MYFHSLHHLNHFERGLAFYSHMESIACPQHFTKWDGLDP